MKIALMLNVALAILALVTGRDYGDRDHSGEDYGGEDSDKRVGKVLAGDARCKTPVEATTVTCTLTKVKALDEACGHELMNACQDAGLGFEDKDGMRRNATGKFPATECDALEVSSEACTVGLKAAFEQTPKCVLEFKRMCREHMDTAPTPIIPGGCVKWFDGCNECAVQDGEATTCTKRFCLVQARPFCAAFEDGRVCQTLSKTTRRVDCKDPGASAPLMPAPARSPTCDDVTSDLDLSDEATCRKALYLCADKPDIMGACKARKEQDEKEKCKTEEHESRKSKCCVEGMLEGDTCKDFGGLDALPEDCETRCVDDGEFKKDAKECVRCRGKGSLRAVAGKAEKLPFDPARVKETIQEIGSKLNENGKKCVMRIANATTTLKARLDRWRKDQPAEKEEPEAETEIKSLAEVYTELEEAMRASKSIEDEFEEDDEGKSYREKPENDDKRLKDKITDSFAPKNTECRAAFEELKNSFNKVVTGYSGLPATLKAQGVKRVEFSFANTDIGSTDLEDPDSVCGFASRFVPELKKAEANHETRLAAARKVLCTETGELLQKQLISRLSNCLRKAKREAQGDAKQEADADAQNFDQNTRKQVQKLLALTKKKCLMKDSPSSEPAQIAGVFRGTLKTRVDKKAGDLTDADREKIAQTVNNAVKKRYPEATDIVTTIEDVPRRRLRARRMLDTGVDVQTTWSTDEVPSAETNDINLETDMGEEFSITAPEVTAETTESSIEVTTDSSIQVTATEAENNPTQEAIESDGTTQVTVGTLAVICATVFAVVF